MSLTKKVGVFVLIGVASTVLLSVRLHLHPHFRSGLASRSPHSNGCPVAIAADPSPAIDCPVCNVAKSNPAAAATGCAKRTAVLEAGFDPAFDPELLRRSRARYGNTYRLRKLIEKLEVGLLNRLCACNSHRENEWLC